jgi:hypothetical protein
MQHNVDCDVCSVMWIVMYICCVMWIVMYICSVMWIVIYAVYVDCDVCSVMQIALDIENSGSADTDNGKSPLAVVSDFFFVCIFYFNYTA